jgi:hypothetical protein
MILAGVEESLGGLGDWIYAVGEIVTTTVASGAGEGEVPVVVAAVEGLGGDVVEGE